MGRDEDGKQPREQGLWQTLLKAFKTLVQCAKHAPRLGEHIPFIPQRWKSEEFPLCSKSMHNLQECAQINLLIWQGQPKIH